MSASIKLIALDLDGTLLGADHDTIPRRNLDALRAAADRGVKIAIATGRSWSLVRETAAQMDAVHYGLTANGACVLEPATGRVLVKTPMDPAQCAAIISILRRRGLSYELYMDGRNYVQRDDIAHLDQFSLSDRFAQMFLRNMTVTEDMLEVVAAGEPEKFDIFYVPPEDREDVIREILTTGPTALSGGLADNLELTAPQANKGVALSALAGQLGLTADQVMAFGDASNDLEMLAWAGWSFAMANASPAVKQTARYQTGSNDQGGVGMAIEQYILT